MSTKSTKRPAHRPSKITEAKVEAAIKVARVGAWFETMAAHVGVSASVFRDWRRRGERERDRLASNPRARPKRSEALYLALSSGIEKALADWEIEQQATVMQFARGVQTVKEKTTVRLERYTDEDGQTKLREVDRQTVKETSIVRSWQAAQTSIERRFPSRHGRRVEVESSLNGEVVLTFEGEGDDSENWLVEEES